MRIRLPPLFVPILLLSAPVLGARSVKTITFASRRVTVDAGTVLVKFKAGTMPAAKTGSLAALGAKSVNELYGWTVVELPPSTPVEGALAAFSARAEVEAVEPSRIYRPLRVPNDPDFKTQYALSRVNAPAAWEFDVGGSSRATVAVIDTGVDGTHPDLSANIKTSLSESFNSSGVGTPENPPSDECGHGTLVAGVAAAATDNGVGVAGMSWQADLLSLRVFETPADCVNGISDTPIAAAIDYAVTLATATNPSAIGHLVINMSLGSPPPCSALLTAAVQNAQSHGAVVVAAAGNLDSTSNPTKVVECPGAIPGVVAVAATDQNDNPATFSAVGPEVVVAAPGVDILSTQRSQDGGGYITDSGTSFASPLVAGLSALLWSAAPSLSSGTVFSILEQSADDLGPPGFDTSYGFGRVNAFRALRLATRGTLSTFDGEAKAIAFPNPAHFSQGNVSFAVPQGVVGSNLSVKIYSSAGELVRTLSGLSWDGKNDGGLSVASGVYIFLVNSDRGQARGRVAVLH